MEFVEVGKITLKEAGEKMGVSYRQTKRIRRKAKEEGIKGIVHKNRGRPSMRKISEESVKSVSKFIASLIRGTRLKI